MTNEKKQAEFLAMLRQSESLLLRLCLHLRSRRDSVEDTYQDVVCVLWEQWPRFRGESSPRTWAVRIALNTIGQKMRWNKHQPRFVKIDRQQLENIAYEPEDPDIELLNELIEHLNDTDKELLMLQLEGMSIDEIAYATGISANAAKQRLYRIRLKLKHIKEIVL